MYGRNRYGTTRYGDNGGQTGAFFKSLSAVVNASGSVARGVGKSIVGTVNASGSVARSIAKSLVGIVNADGIAARSIAKSLAVAVNISGAVTRSLIYAKSLVATVNISGTVQRGIAKGIAATVNISGTARRAMTKALATVVNVAGEAKRETRKSFLASVNVSSSLARTAGKGIVGIVNLAGDVSNRHITKGIVAIVNLEGTVGRAMTKAMATVVNIAGAVARTTHNIYGGGVQIAASVGRVIHKHLVATVNAVSTASRIAYDMAYEMNKPIRQILGKVQITYTDPFFSAGITATASETGRFTYPSQTTDNVTTEDYKWFSLHRNLLDGTFHPLPSNQEYSVGWWSANVCSGAGAFWPYPVLTIEHAARSVESLLVVGDDKLNEYPTWFVVRLYTAGDVLVHTEACNTNTDVTWTKDVGPFNDIVKQTLTITKWSRASSVAKISQFFTMLEETYEGEDLFSIGVLEEREFSQATIPQGNISANVLTVRLNNIDDLFNAGNFNSRLYGYLLNNRAIKAWLGCDLHTGGRVWFPLGTFYTRDWNAPEGEAYAEVTGYDMLDRLKQTDFTTSEVYENITLYDLAIIVMTDAGLTAADWDIDATLDTAAYTIPYAWFSPMSHREALKRIAAAALGQCYCNRDGKIVLEIYVAPTAAAYDFEFDQANFFDIDHPLEWSQMINSVQARANPLVKSAEQDICSDVETFTVPAGSSVTKTHFFDSAPCVEVVDPVVYVNPGGNVTLGDRTDYAWGITQAYANATGGDETVTSVTIRGKLLEVQGGRIVSAEDTDSIAQNGLQSMSEPVSSSFWQTSAQSQAVADALLASYKDPRRDVLIKARGNIAMLLGDRIIAPDYRDEVTMEYGLMRQDINWDGGMDVAVTAQKILDGHLIYKKHLVATVNVPGLVRQWVEEYTGGVNVEATVGRVISKHIVATVNAGGTVGRAMTKDLAGDVSVGGTIEKMKTIYKSLAATVNVTGDVSERHTAKGIEGVVSVGGSLAYNAGTFYLQASAHLKELEDVYNDAWNMASAQRVDYDPYYSNVGHWKNTAGGVYYAVERAYGVWLTEDIPAGATIINAELHIATETRPTNAAVLQVVNGQPTHPSDSPVREDFDRLEYAGDGGSLDLDATVDVYHVLTLNASGRSWIQKGPGALTKLCFRTEQEISGSMPVNADDDRYYDMGQIYFHGSPYPIMLKVLWAP